MKHNTRVFKLLSTIALIIAISIVFGFPPVFVTAEQISDEITQQDISKVFKRDVPTLISQLYDDPIGFGLNPQDLCNAVIGNGLTVARFDAEKILPANDVIFFPLINDNGIFAILTALKCEGYMSCTLGISFAPYLDSFCDNVESNDKYIIFTNQDGVFALNEDDVISSIYYNSDINIPDFDVSFANNELSKCITSKLRICSTGNQLMKFNDVIRYNNSVSNDIETTTVIHSPPTHFLSNYPIIPQNSLPICWAASIASIVNYEIGSTFSAVGVCQALNHDYTGEFVGNIDNHLDALLPSPYVPTVIWNPLADNDIKTVINNDDPAFMDSVCYQNTNRHATALYGYWEDSSGYLYTLRIMDPATGTKMSCTRASSTAPWNFNVQANTYRWAWTVRLLYG